jgi:glucokinase
MGAMILAGDAGGTKIGLGLYRIVGGAPILAREQVYATHNYHSLESVILDFAGREGHIAAACFGVPGPVFDGISRPVNIPWEIHEQSLSAALHGIPVRLLNDLEATAWGALHLPDENTEVLQSGKAREGPFNMVIIAAGTGLGEAGMVRTRDAWRMVATEGGHADFAPRGEEQELLLKFLAHEFDHVSFERLVSGPGLHNIYRFVVSRNPGDEPGWLAERLRTEDPAAVIGEVGVHRGEPRCVRALEIFTAIYGAEAANLALKYLALGGVYLCGGIAPKILPALREGGFMRAFLDKGRLRSTLEQIPVRVSLNPGVGLIGAAYAAASMI